MLLQIPSATLSVKTGCKPSYLWIQPTLKIHKNNAVMIDGNGIGGMSTDIAEFNDTFQADAISLKRPCTTQVGLDVMSGLVVDQVIATDITTGTFASNGDQL